MTSKHPPRAPESMQCSRQMLPCNAAACMPGSKEATPKGLLSFLKSQDENRLTPHQMKTGKVVYDNGTDLLSDFHLGNLMHELCLVHVLSHKQ